MVSMKDIAAVCSVSVATVSKALNDQGDIGGETKEYIRKTAREMGYIRNSSASALKTKRSYNLGVLFVDEAGNGLTHDHFASILDSFKVTAEAQGYDLTFINCNRNRRNRMSYLEHSIYRGFDGVVIACVNFQDAEVVELVESDLPVVTIDHLFNNRITIVSNQVRGMRDLLTYIYEQGHRRIAFIHGADSAVTQGRLSSFYNTAEELGLEIPDEYVKMAAYRNSEEAANRTEELLALREIPTCIIYPDDFSCFGGINAIRARGMKIPEDISVAGYDGIRVGRHIEPRLTTLRQDTTRMGRLAAEKLINLIEKPKSTLIEQIIVNGALYPGETVGNINAT